jgi:hypothetical protein
VRRALVGLAVVGLVACGHPKPPTPPHVYALSWTQGGTATSWAVSVDGVMVAQTTAPTWTLPPTIPPGVHLFVVHASNSVAASPPSAPLVATLSPSGIWTTPPSTTSMLLSRIQ